MSAIEFEDRTTELPDADLQRQVTAASRAIIGTAIRASQGNPTVGLGALILALSEGAARSGASLEAIIEALRSAFAAAEAQIEITTRRPSDA